jgi:SAM-dependent methyltransferase
MLQDALRIVAGAGLPPRVLEIGAGHGGYTAELLDAGCQVTRLDLSASAIAFVRRHHPEHERLSTVIDPEATLDEAGSDQSLVLLISVLHHIPDYLAFLDRVMARLAPGGAALLLEEPLWYPRVGRVTRLADRGSYLAWRTGQGEIRSGLASMWRRARRIPLEAVPGEIVYYHVVRNGVDEQAVAAMLASWFDRVELSSYWSNHLALSRPLAETLRLVNTFGMRATGFVG